MKSNIAHLVHALAGAVFVVALFHYYVFDLSFTWLSFVPTLLIVPFLVVYLFGRKNLGTDRKTLSVTALIAMLFTVAAGLIIKFL